MYYQISSIIAITIMDYNVSIVRLVCLLLRGGSRNYREGFPYHNQWHKVTAILLMGDYVYHLRIVAINVIIEHYQ